MRRLTLIYFLMIVGVLYSQDTKTIASNILKSTVSIVVKDANSQTLGLGSGFIIENGLVVTNVHVIKGAKSVYIKNMDSSVEYKSLGYVAIDKKNDLVILKVPSLTGQSLQFSNNTQEVGEKIYVVGNPSGLSGTFTDGLISGIRDFESRKLIQISAPISPGSSGGPVVNGDSELVGISVGGMRDGQNLNFCIPVEYLKTLYGRITVLSPFNIRSEPEPKQAVYSGIRSSVVVRSLEIERESDSSSLLQVASFSIFNNLSKPIANVKILFIIYDTRGIPVDNKEVTFLENNNLRIDSFGGFILPKLAKRVYPFGSYGISVTMNRKERIEIRVLDYDVIEEN
ncbi:MAG: S1C family serine protease [Bacteroidales bacterium]